MNVAIVGAGAMGSLFAARLADAGENVVLLEACPDVRAARIRDGVLLATQDGVTARPIACCDPSRFDVPQELLLVATKAQDTAAALATTAHLIAGQGYALSLQNGLTAMEAFSALLPPERILLGVTDLAADRQDGRIWSAGSGDVRIGSFVPGAAEPAVTAVAAMFNRAGLPTICEWDVRVAIWEKVAFNAAFNALATVTGLSVSGLDNPPGRALVSQAAEETIAVALAMGVAVDREQVFARIDHAFREQGGHVPSMLQDRRVGWRTEIEAINGAVVRHGDALSLSVTVNRTLADLVRLTGG
jgi:2-dehydropantoate 2-reductase